MVTDRRKINLRGTLPPYPSGAEAVTATLIIHDSRDGYLLLPSGLTIKKEVEENPMTFDSDWNDSLDAYDQQWSFRFPFIGILYETIRNTFFHVAIWMAMFVLLIVSLIYSITLPQKFGFGS